VFVLPALYDRAPGQTSVVVVFVAYVSGASSVNNSGIQILLVINSVLHLIVLG
jgi:hypothetical protein